MAGMPLTTVVPPAIHNLMNNTEEIMLRVSTGTAVAPDGLNAGIGVTGRCS